MAVLPLASRTSGGLQRLAELLLRQSPEGMARLAPALRRLCSTALADPYTFKARGLLEGDSLRHAVARGRDVWFALSGLPRARVSCPSNTRFPNLVHGYKQCVRCCLLKPKVNLHL